MQFEQHICIYIIHIFLKSNCTFKYLIFWSSNSALIFDFSPSLKRISNLVGTWGGGESKNPEKVTKKLEFLRITTYRQKSIF
jgi:hypothetical protein